VKRIRHASKEDFDKSLFFVLPSILSDRLIELYLKSRSYASANWAASRIISNMSDLSAQQKIYILSNIKDNDQVLYSNTLGALINKIRTSLSMEEGAFNSLLKEKGLENYVTGNADDSYENIPF